MKMQPNMEIFGEKYKIISENMRNTRINKLSDNKGLTRQQMGRRTVLEVKRKDY